MTVCGVRASMHQLEAVPAPISHPLGDCVRRTDRNDRRFFDTTPKRKNGIIGVPRLPGIGAELDREAIRPTLAAT